MKLEGEVPVITAQTCCGNGHRVHSNTVYREEERNSSPTEPAAVTDTSSGGKSGQLKDVSLDIFLKVIPVVRSVTRNCK